MTREQAAKLARAYDAYIRFRAQKEGVQYALSPAFFEANLMCGCTCFFGVSFAGSELSEDCQDFSLNGRACIDTGAAIGL